MELLKFILSVGICTIFVNIILLGIWYNGVLNVSIDDENGDSAKLDILEYDKVRKRSFMILLIKRKNK